MTVLLILSVVSVLLNGSCMLIISRSNSLLKKPSTYLIINLLVMQLLQGVFVLPLYAAKKFQFENLDLRIFVCDTFRFTYMLTYYGTCLGVLFISIDRFLATRWIWLYKARVTKKRVLISIGILWIYLISLNSIPFIKSKHVHKHLQCNYDPQHEWSLFMILTNAVVPYILIILCYQYVIYTMKRMDHDINVLNDDKESKLNEKIDKKHIVKYKKVTHTSMVLALVYAVFWFPSILYFTFLSIFQHSPFIHSYFGSRVEIYIGFNVKLLSFLDAIAAPIVYCFEHKEFRMWLSNLKTNGYSKLPNKIKSVREG